MYRKIKEHYFTLDWLSFTFSWKTLRDVGLEVEDHIRKYISIWSYFKKQFPEFATLSEDMVTLENGRYGYENAISFNNELLIMTTDEDRDDFGVFVTVPSHGLYILGKIFGLPDFNQDFSDTQKLFQILLSRGAKITRIDICYDDYNKHMTPNDWRMLWDSKHIDSRTKFSSAVSSASGDTFYMGKRGKSRMLRIYDKSGESRGEIDAIRYEFEMKNEYAYRFATSIAAGEKFTFLDLLDSFCSVKAEPIEGLHCSGSIAEVQKRWRDKNLMPLLDRFERLREDIRNSSQNAECVPVLVPRVSHARDFYKKEQWIKEYLVKALQKHCLARGDTGYSWLLEQMQQSQSKFTASDWAEVQHNLDWLNV